MPKKIFVVEMLRALMGILVMQSFYRPFLRKEGKGSPQGLGCQD